MSILPITGKHPDPARLRRFVCGIAPEPKAEYRSVGMQRGWPGMPVQPLPRRSRPVCSVCWSDRTRP